MNTHSIKGYCTQKNILLSIAIKQVSVVWYTIYISAPDFNILYSSWFVMPLNLHICESSLYQLLLNEYSSLFFLVLAWRNLPAANQSVRQHPSTGSFGSLMDCRCLNFGFSNSDGGWVSADEFDWREAERGIWWFQYLLWYFHTARSAVICWYLISTK